MCESCSTRSGIDGQIAYLERVIKDQESLKAKSKNPALHDQAIEKARQAIFQLRTTTLDPH